MIPELAIAMLACARVGATHSIIFGGFSADAVAERNRLDSNPENPDAGAFNTMTTNMYALTEALLGRGEQAFKLVSMSLRRLDPSGVAMGEALKGALFYFATGYTTYALAIVQMLLQSHDDIIRPFPAVPRTWKDLSFRDLPAEGGILVSGRMRGGRVEFVRYSHRGRALLETQSGAPVRVLRRGDERAVEPVRIDDRDQGGA